MLLVDQWDKLVGYALLIHLENLLQLLLLPRMIYIQHKLDKFGGAICNLNKINVFGNNSFFPPPPGLTMPHLGWTNSKFCFLAF